MSSSTSVSSEDFLPKNPNNSIKKKEKNINLININKSISNLLTNIQKENCKKISYQKILKSQQKSIFTSKSIPLISIKDFIERIKKYMKIEDNTLILGLIYMDRFCAKNFITLTEYNTHRLYFISVLTALKYQEDIYYKNTFYAKICGVKVEDLNNMEYEFVVNMNFDFYVSRVLYKKYRDSLKDE